MTSSTTARFEAYFDQWLHTLEADTHGGTDARPDTPTRPTAPVRYGEWEGPDGSTRPVRTSRPEWMRNQIDMALALSGLVTPDDVVIVAAPYELSLEGASVERAVEWLGASLISVGTSNTICPVPRLLGLLHRYRATTLVCSPQLAADLAALDEAGGRRPAAAFTREARPLFARGEAEVFETPTSAAPYRIAELIGAVLRRDLDAVSRLGQQTADDLPVLEQLLVGEAAEGRADVADAAVLAAIEREQGDAA
ncbi:hypothetical protein [Streptomyces incanus]|uniref:Uncharacterized protein n=1 Tax=Streptomyces incanus TaxID=887453 RepID=A0ABW0XXQ8_9ACTN